MKPASGGFPPANRLRIKADFDRVFQRPNQRCSQGVLQAIYKVTDLDDASSSPRLGLIIAKRFLPLAVQRNRVKRLIRDAFRTRKHDLPQVDIIVRLVKKPSDEVSASDVRDLFGKMQDATANNLPENTPEKG